MSAPAWFGLGYVALLSMLLGFVFWYRGLAQGGIAAVGQLQLVQPFFGLRLAALLLHESVSGAMLMGTLGAVVCVARARTFAPSLPGRDKKSVSFRSPDTAGCRRCAPAPR